ncbi:MAG: hypothetical protein K2O97_12205, partial [Acetatifactor sp.]|nr:hypothetical protein [Acetatifactor sp.]
VSVLYSLWFGMTYGTLEKSTFLRMYTWGAFFVTASALFLFFYYEKNRKRDILVGSIMTLAAMYTHYYAVISVFLMWVILLLLTLIKKRKQTGIVLTGGALVTVGYLPWLNILLSQSRRVAESYWMTDFNWDEWRLVPAALMESSDEAFNGTGMVLYSFLILLLFLALIKRRWDALTCVVIFGGTMLAGALFSLFVTPVWATRYMYVDWGLMALFAAITAGEVTSAFSDISQGLLVLVLAIVGGISAGTMMMDETMSSTADEWVAFLADNVDESACMIVDDPSEHDVVFRFYLPDANFIFTEELLRQDTEEGLRTFLSESAGHQIWYVIDYRQQKIGTEKMQACLEELGYTVEAAGSFTIEHKSLEVFKVEVTEHEG